MRRFVNIVFLLSMFARANAQQILLTRAQVLKLPCKILTNTHDTVAGYFNSMDSSLYNCRGNFKGTLAGGYMAINDYTCKEMRLPVVHRKACRVDYFSSIIFKPGSLELNSNAKAILASTAILLELDSLCGVSVVGYVADTAQQKAHQLSWDRINTIIKYLVEKQHVPQSRILFNYDGVGSANVVDLIAATVGGEKRAIAPGGKEK